MHSATAGLARRQRQTRELVVSSVCEFRYSPGLGLGCAASALSVVRGSAAAAAPQSQMPVARLGCGLVRPARPLLQLAYFTAGLAQSADSTARH